MNLSWKAFDALVEKMALRIPKDARLIYGVPRGGCFVAMALQIIWMLV